MFSTGVILAILIFTSLSIIVIQYFVTKGFNAGFDYLRNSRIKQELKEHPVGKKELLINYYSHLMPGEQSAEAVPTQVGNVVKEPVATPPQITSEVQKSVPENAPSSPPPFWELAQLYDTSVTYEQILSWIIHQDFSKYGSVPEPNYDGQKVILFKSADWYGAVRYLGTRGGKNVFTFMFPAYRNNVSAYAGHMKGLLSAFESMLLSLDPTAKRETHKMPASGAQSRPVEIQQEAVQTNAMQQAAACPSEGQEAMVHPAEGQPGKIFSQQAGSTFENANTLSRQNVTPVNRTPTSPPKKRLALVVAALAFTLVVLAGISDASSPKRTVDKFFNSAKNGDITTTVECFTPMTQHQLKTAYAIADSFLGIDCNTLLSAVLGNVYYSYYEDYSFKSVKTERRGDRASVQVEVYVNGKKESVTSISCIKIDGKWYIDQ